MKQFHSLFILLIGMISFTAVSSTPLPEQKQKTTFQTELSVPFVVADVLSFSYVSAEPFTAVMPGSSTLGTPFVQKSVKPLDFAIVPDIGWRICEQRFRQIPYKEKLLENYNLHFKNKPLLDTSTIRGDC